MCLRKDDDSTNDDGIDVEAPAPARRFIYGRLLGVFHANVVYGGPGMLDHRPWRFDLLWVRWYEPTEPTSQADSSTVWSTRRLETYSLMPLSNPEACNFINPADVVRAAHIIPQFSAGKCYEDHKDQTRRLFSKWAGDCDEWNEYCVNV